MIYTLYGLRIIFFNITTLTFLLPRLYIDTIWSDASTYNDSIALQIKDETPLNTQQLIQDLKNEIDLLLR